MALHGMKQHINKATHRAGHTLDALITREVDNIISGVQAVSIIGMVWLDT